MVATTDFLAFLSLALLAVGAIVLAEWARALDFLRLTTSRRLIHLTVGLFVAIAVIAIESPVWLFVSGAITFIVNLVAIRQGWFASMHGPESKSHGTVTFPLGLMVVLPFIWNLSPIDRYPLALAFAILAVADPVAAIVGTMLANRHRVLGAGPEGKTLAGFIGFGFTAWLITGLWITLIASVGQLPFDEMWIWHMAAMVGIIAASAEMVARRGWDNFLIVIAVVIVLYSAQSDESVKLLGWCVGVSAVFGFLGYRLGFLTADGAFSTALMGGTILFLADWNWIIPPVTFFLAASLLSKWSSARRLPEHETKGRGGRRDAIQVLANGGVGLAIVILYGFAPHPWLYWLFVASFAAAAADTFATEVGTAAGGRTWLITSLLPVTPGTSGGVSQAGLLAAMLGAGFVGSVSTVFASSVSISAMGFAIVSGLAGSIFDSVLGATIQARYVTLAGETTEESISAGVANRHQSGYKFVTNDAVNFFCTGTAVVIMGWLLLLWTF